MKKLLIMIFIIFLSTHFVYSKASSEINQIEVAKGLVKDKKFNDAIALLTNYVSENPNAIYEVQSLIDEIRSERDINNTLMGDIIIALYDDEDFEEGARLIKEYERNNPFPDELSKTFIKDAREASTFVINQKNFIKYMDLALENLKNGEFNSALDNYVKCMDFHVDEFDLLMDEEVVPQQVSLDLTEVNEDIPINQYLISLKNSSFNEVDDLKENTDLLKEYITTLQEAYNKSLNVIESETINIEDLENSLANFKEVPEYLEKFTSIINQLNNYNDLFEKVTVDGKKSKFISYASLTLTGRKDTEEGILYTINRMFPIYMDKLVANIEDRVSDEFNQSIELYENGENTLSNSRFDETIISLKALDTTASIWKVFVKVDENFNITGSDIIEKKYPYIGDSRIGIEIADSYKNLIVYNNNIVKSEKEESDELYRSLLVTLNSRLNEDSVYWSNKKEDVDNRKVMKFRNASSWIQNIVYKYNSLEQDLKEREITLLDNISAKSYIDIFGFDVDSVDDNNDAIGELISNAAIPTNEPDIIKVYFDINNTDERTLTTYNPEESLINLENIETDYSVFIENLELYIEKFQNEKEYIFENVNFNTRFKSIQNALNLANKNKNNLITYKTEAEDKITASKEAENRGNRLYQDALIAFDNENFNDARNYIETGKSVSEVSLSYSKNEYVINQLIPSFYTLWDNISKEEARIVIRDVRNLITLGKNQYIEGAYIPASNLFREAELRWSETNSEAHPEIPYWLALIRDALDIESGRYLTITEPLYSILAGYLSFAENYYRTGLQEENKVNKLKAFAIADSYIIKVLEVKPLNERARFLQLQVLKSKDPEAFKVIFNNDFIRYRNSVIQAIDDNESLQGNSVLSTLAIYENIVVDAYLLNPRLSGSNRRRLLERFYTPITTTGKSQTAINLEKSDNEEKRKKINESYIRFKDLYKIADNEQKIIVKRLMDISEVALGFKRLPVDTSNIRESNRIFLLAKNRLDNTNQTEIDELNNIMEELQRALSLNPRNDDIPVVIDDILVMLGEESNFQLAPEQDKIFREAQKDFIDGRYYDAKDKIVDILKANSKNKNYPKLKELINRVEIKIKEEITI